MNIAFVPRSAVQTRLALGWTIIDVAPHPASWAVLMQIPDIEVETEVEAPVQQPIRGSNKSQGARSRNLVRYAGAE